MLYLCGVAQTHTKKLLLRCAQEGACRGLFDRSVLGSRSRAPIEAYGKQHMQRKSRNLLTELVGGGSVVGRWWVGGGSTARVDGAGRLRVGGGLCVRNGVSHNTKQTDKPEQAKKDPSLLFQVQFLLPATRTTCKKQGRDARSAKKRRGSTRVCACVCAPIGFAPATRQDPPRRRRFYARRREVWCFR
jgi:hypothetical protein